MRWHHSHPDHRRRRLLLLLAALGLTCTAALAQEFEGPERELTFAFPDEAGLYEINILRERVNVTLDGQPLAGERYEAKPNLISIFDDAHNLRARIDLFATGGTLNVFTPPPVKAWMGVWMGEVDEALAAQLRVQQDQVTILDGVAEDSPAATAGLQKHDVILKINGESLATADRVREVIASRKPGDRLELTLMRAGKEMTIPVQLGARTDAEKSVPILRNIPILGTYFARKDGVVVPMAGIEAHPGGTIYRKADPEGTPFEASFQYYSTREGQHVVTVPSTTTVTTSKSGRVTMEGATVVTEEPDLETRLERLEARLEKLTTILEGLLEKVGEGK